MSGAGMALQATRPTPGRLKQVGWALVAASLGTGALLLRAEHASLAWRG